MVVDVDVVWRAETFLAYFCAHGMKQTAQREGTLHVCGELCAQKLQSQFMGNVRENMIRRGEG